MKSQDESIKNQCETEEIKKRCLDYRRVACRFVKEHPVTNDGSCGDDERVGDKGPFDWYIGSSVPHLKKPGNRIAWLLYIFLNRSYLPFQSCVVNRNTVVDVNSSPGRRMVPGKLGWLGESGKCCVSRQIPLFFS